MIAFRAPEDVAKILADGEFVTGRTRTDLLITLVRQFLPRVVVDLSHEHQRRIKAARDTFVALSDAPAPSSQAPQEMKHILLLAA